MLLNEDKKIKCTEVEEEDITGVRMKVLIGDQEGATNYVMRVFDIARGGHTAYHTHDWEHEVYVIQGKGAVKQKDTEHPVQKGSFILVKSNEEHQFINKGLRSFRFICVVPLMKKD
jgi:quercetin dioxygenase-like cupin family protein